MGKYKLSVTWEMVGEMDVEAESEEDAINKAHSSPYPNYGRPVSGSLYIEYIESENDDIEKFRL